MTDIVVKPEDRRVHLRSTMKNRYGEQVECHVLVGVADETPSGTITITLGVDVEVKSGERLVVESKANVKRRLDFVPLNPEPMRLPWGYPFPGER